MSERERTLVELPSGVKVEIAELTASESLQADDMVGNSRSPMRAMKTYAIASIRTLDGEPVVPFKNELEFMKVAKRLTATDAFTLADRYSDLYSPPAAEDLKNEPSASTED